MFDWENAIALDTMQGPEWIWDIKDLLQKTNGREENAQRDFGGKPAATTLPSNAEGEGSVSGWAANIPHAL